MIYRFNDIALDTDRRELSRLGRAVQLEPQVFDLLEYLVRNRERVASKDDILQAIWRGRFVSEATVSTRINAARRAIGDNGTEQRLIRTIRGRGFRFVAPVQQDALSYGRGRSSMEAQKRSAALLDRPTIAVLPFASLSGSRKSQLFAEGLTESLLTALTKIDWLLVTPWESSLHEPIENPHFARKLGVRYALRGHVSQLGNSVRITVRLLDALSNRYLSADSYDRDIAAVFAVLDEITDRVLAAIGPPIFAAEDIRAECKSRKELNAWECMIAALSLMNSRARRNLADAAALLQRAIVIDPKSAKAHSLLSFITTLSVHQGWQRQQTALPLALCAADDALSLNNEEPWAHLARGYAVMWRHPEETIRPLERALTLNPQLAVGHYILALAMTRSGWPNGVLDRAELATMLSPRDLLARGNAGIYNNLRASSSFITGRYREGIAHALGAILESPRLAPAHRQLVANYALSGQISEARAAMKALRRLTPDISLQWIRDEWNWSRKQDQIKYVEAFRMAGVE